MQAEWQKFWREPRNRVLFLVFLLLAGYAVFMQVTSATTSLPAEVEQVREPMAAAAEKSEKPKRVKGAEKAEKNSVLQDPFHIQHAARQEAAEPLARMKPVVKQEQVRSGTAASGRKKTELHLMGVLQGTNRSVALLVFNGKKVSLAVGESIDGYKLESVERECAYLTGPDGEMILHLGK
ncbi:MAG: hypothetical protein WCS30_03950 [Selenomonadaceae bacterium]